MIEIMHLKKQFGKLEVLKDVSLTIDNGAVTAIVGPNGSGKTTLIKSILGLVKPDAGEIDINKERLNGHWQYRQAIGYMPQFASFPENLRVAEIFNMVQDIRHNPTTVDNELFQQFGLQDEMEKTLGTLSGGTRQKVSAALTFLFDPQVLILDEPTAGLDPLASSILKDKIRQECEKGKTIILTSHIMSEVEELADRIIFLVEGKIAFSGSTDEIRSTYGGDTLERAIAQLLEGGIVV